MCPIYSLDAVNPSFGTPLLDSGTEYQVQCSAGFTVHFVTVDELIDSIYGARRHPIVFPNVPSTHDRTDLAIQPHRRV
jgi:hypothetical protein